MLMRLSTRGNAVSGTAYSPGVALPATCAAGWIRPASTPPISDARALSAAAESFATGLVVGLAAGFAAGLAPAFAGVWVPVFAAAAPLAVSAFPESALVLVSVFALSRPRSCSTAEGLPFPVSPLIPRPRRVRSIAGMALSSALVLLVIL